jgi:hypothetical protein
LLLVLSCSFSISSHHAPKISLRISVHTLCSISNPDQQLQVNNQSIGFHTNNTTHHNSKYALLHPLHRALCGRRLRPEQRCQHYRKSPIASIINTSNPNNSSQSTTAPYTNAFTSYLTQTNSLGVITGMPAVATAQSALPPAVTTQPEAVTSQPEVATIPAGLPEGVTHIMQNISRSLTSFEVSVGSSTTVVIGAASDATIVTGTGTETGAAATASSSSGSSSNDDDSSASGSPSSNDESGSSTSGSGAAESTGSADSSAGRVTLASAGVLGFGALVAAFL